MEEQAIKAEKTSRSTATLIVGLAIATLGYLVKAFGEGSMRGAAMVADITGGPVDSSGALAFLIGFGVLAIGAIMVAVAVVWKLIAWLSD